MQDPGRFSVVSQRAWRKRRVHCVYSEVKPSHTFSHCLLAQLSVLNTSGFVVFFQGNLSKASRSSAGDSEVSLTHTTLFKLLSISFGFRIAMDAYICTARMLSGPSVPARAKTTSGPLSSPLRVLVSVLSVCLAHREWIF